MNKIVSIIIALIFVSPFIALYVTRNRRYSTAYVTDMKYKADEWSYTLTTPDGHKWGYNDKELHLSQAVEVVFDTMGTDDLEDDEIIKVIR